MTDEDYMKQALQLARRGLGKTSPNPMVGAVIVKDNRIIAKGYHHYFGGKHAEIDAIRNARESVEGATLYVTLEPCCHHGKTPPCVEAVLRHKLGRVVIGVLDPNPLVNGKSVALLKKKGIATRVGILEGECRSLNEAYFKHITTGVPLVTLKFAQTLDGRIAAVNRSSRWISSEKFQYLVHKLRAGNDAVMVGVGTILADDPQLTVRLVKGRNPTRIVLDSGLRIPLDSKVVVNKDAATIVTTTSRADGEKSASLREAGVEVLVINEDNEGGVDIKHLLNTLGERGIASVLVEGGSSVITSFLRHHLVDKLVVAIAPKIVGKGIEAVGELSIGDISRSLKLSFSRTYRMGDDLVIEARVEGGAVNQ